MVSGHRERREFEYQTLAPEFVGLAVEVSSHPYSTLPIPENSRLNLSFFLQGRRCYLMDGKSIDFIAFVVFNFDESLSLCPC